MVKDEFTFPSNDGKTAVHAVEWLPEGETHAVLQIAHGVAEHILRYESLAEFLTLRGIAVVGNDHLGHGLSVEPRGTRLHFGPIGSWGTVVDDLYTFRSMEGRKFPNVPYFLMGHSMGSFLARTYLIRYPGTVDGAILMGTGQMSPAMLAGGKMIAAAEIRRRGEAQISPVVEKRSFETYNKLFAPNRTDSDWLSADEKYVDAYRADPLCGGSATLGLFREMLNGICFIIRPSNLKKMNMTTPVIFLSGSMDAVGDCGKGVQRAFRSFQKVGVRDLSIKLYPGARHEILNDLCQETVYQDLAAWMGARIPV